MFVRLFILNKYYKIITIDLSKKVFDADPRAIQQINFTVNLDRDGNTTMFFIIEVFILKYKNIIKIKRNLMMFILGIICLTKQRMGHIW